MPTQSTILIENISLESEDSSFSYSEKKKGSGYHMIDSGLHTYQYLTDNFQGTIKLQGSLSMYPGDNDWIDIDNTEIFSKEGDSTVISENISGNFIGNFIWIRAAYNLDQGTITRIRYNH
jgi:hypothetical protein